jgi:hypothetical protein
MRTFRPRRAGRLGALLALAAAGAAVPAAQAAKPVSATVLPNERTVLPAHRACPFRVIDEALPGSRRVERVYRNGRHVVSGPARERLTNPANGRSIVRNGSGVVSYRKDGDGTTRFAFSGPVVLYFYPGDAGPRGVAGEDGALFHVTGKVRETLAEDGTVTSFGLRGRARELCRLLA